VLEGSQVDVEDHGREDRRVAGLPMVIDSDGGTDDAVALWWAATDPRIDLLAVVATWGNVPVGVALANVRRVLRASGRDDVAVVAGAAGPTASGPLGRRAVEVHAGDGLGGHAGSWPESDLPLAPPDHVRDRLASTPGELAVVTIGPLSTLARSAAAVAPLARSLTLMGGSARAGGNVTPVAEANIALDPAAAAAVLAAGWRSPPLLVGLDVTMAALLGPDELAAAESSSTPAGRFLAGPVRAYAEVYGGHGWTPPGHVPCHDLLAVLATVDPAVLTEVVEAPVGVDTGGSAAWGATVVDLRPGTDAPGWPVCRVALGVDVDAFRSAFRALMG
jgi:purine nucleosidase